MLHARPDLPRRHVVAGRNPRNAVGLRGHHRGRNVDVLVAARLEEKCRLVDKQGHPFVRRPLFCRLERVEDVRVDNAV